MQFAQNYLKEFNAQLGIPRLILQPCKPPAIVDPLEPWVQIEQKAWTTSCCFPVFSSGLDDFPCEQLKKNSRNQRINILQHLNNSTNRRCLICKPFLRPEVHRYHGFFHAQSYTV